MPSTAVLAEAASIADTRRSDSASATAENRILTMLCGSGDDDGEVAGSGLRLLHETGKGPSSLTFLLRLHSLSRCSGRTTRKIGVNAPLGVVAAERGVDACSGSTFRGAGREDEGSSAEGPTGGGK